MLAPLAKGAYTAPAMIARVYAATAIGFEGKQIEVECDASNGLPALLIVGLGNKAIDEAKERVRSAIKNSGLEFPRKRVTINLAPANLPKDGAHFDLSIAIALLVVSGQLKQETVASTVCIGELALDGTLRPVRGIISHVETARSNGHNFIIVPQQNVQQATLVNGICVLPATTLRDVFLHFAGQQIIQAASGAPPLSIATKSIHLSDVRGQEQAKRALTIAAAGHHNILLSGPPGAGKTMLAKALASILPPLNSEEIVEVTKIHSLAGETYEEVLATRPFRSPHHSSSHVALVGGGQLARPGEISLAHHGVLFLDELPEYSRQTLEALRQPLEDHVVHISRATHRASYPADFMLVATQNPCPCGFAGDQTRNCTCSPLEIVRYRKKLSGPLLDRIDMFLEVSRVDHKKLLQTLDAQDDPSTLIAQARQLQYERFNSSRKTNAHLDSKAVSRIAMLTTESKTLLDSAAKSLDLSARSFFKIIKVARTIADLEQSKPILPAHISEALQYRPRSIVY